MTKKGLTELECKNALPVSKRYRLADSGGLYMEIWPNGSKYWRFKYRYLGKEKLLALGVYPLITLREAREARDIARKKVFSGLDPSAARKREKQLAILNSENTFESVAREWHAQQEEKWSQVHSRNVLNLLVLNIFPSIGPRPIAELSAPELLSVLRKVEKRGAAYLSNRIKQICGQVFRYGIATGRGQRDHAADLKGALKATKVEHFAALDIKEMPEFLSQLDKNNARLYERTRRAIRLLMLTFVRTSELIEAEWDEFDFENSVWEIPAERMKMSKPHIVPLSKQAIALLRDQREENAVFNACKWVFPSQIRPLDPMSNNTILFAIGRLGYKGRMTGHGFRALAMTTIKEKLGYLPKPYTDETFITVMRAATRDRRQRQFFAGRLDGAATAPVAEGQFSLRTISEAQDIALRLGVAFTRQEVAANGLYELLLNAIEHGNLKLGYEAKGKVLAEGGWEAEIARRAALPENASKRVTVDVARAGEKTEITIRDEGDGFDPRPYMEIDLSRLTQANGRGIAKANLVAFEKLEYLGNGSAVKITGA